MGDSRTAIVPGSEGAAIELPEPPSDRSDLPAMGRWVAECLDARDQLVWRTVVRRLVREVENLRDAIERHQAWKAEAIEVARMWEDVWVALGRPGELGEFKAVAALRTVLNGRTGADDV